MALNKATDWVTGIMKTAILVVVLIFATSVLAHAEGSSSRENHRQKSLDPMNRPMDELGITGKDDTLCSDRWYSCTTYDRQQFDQKYPGQPLNELLRFGEPNWPDRPRDEREWRERRDGGDSFGYHDRLDKD
jgi:hypothetical protein